MKIEKMMNLEKYSTNLPILGSNDREFKYALQKEETYRKSHGVMFGKCFSLKVLEIALKKLTFPSLGSRPI